MMATTPIDTTRGPLNTALSLAIAEVDGTIPNIAALLDRADFALSQAWRSGGNRVALFGK